MSIFAWHKQTGYIYSKFENKKTNGNIEMINLICKLLLFYIRKVTNDIRDLLYQQEMKTLDNQMMSLFNAIDETIKAYEKGEF